MLWKYIPLSFSPRECFLLFQPHISNFVHTADICKIGLQAFYSAQHSLLRHYESLGMKLVAILEWKLCKPDCQARDDMPPLKLLLPVSLSLFTQLQHDLQDKSYGCGCEEHKCSALFLFPLAGLPMSVTCWPRLCGCSPPLELPVTTLWTPWSLTNVMSIAIPLGVTTPDTSYSDMAAGSE